MRLFFRRDPGGDGDDDRSSSAVSEREVDLLCAKIANAIWAVVCEIDRERAVAGQPPVTLAELEAVFYGDDTP
ncbi:hypothetical protein AB3X94_08045 [Paraburkholderia sp. BR10923]|uniref:hypothetical protein n=1 Tax=Paraburkholderia sp. BR10923 TaxID=3236992 RepID=UPI0034CF810D